MPGSAGGGHSGGSFGGGHSGGFSGGSRSSGGSSHSGSFGSGSRSSSSSSSRSYSGGYRPVYRSGGSSYRRSGSSGNSGCFSGILGVILVPLIIMFVIMVVVAGMFNNFFTSDMPDTFTGEVSSVAVSRDKLSPTLCKPVAKTVETDLNVLTEEGIAEIEKALEIFYDATGVQPYFMLMSGIDGVSFPDYDTVNDYLYDKYVDTFGSDEGHLIVLMFMDGDMNYESWYITGDDAVEVVSYDDCETILTMIDDYAADSTDVADVIADAFTAAPDQIMRTVEYHYYDDAGNEVLPGEIVQTNEDKLNGVLGLIFLAGIVVTVLLVVRYVIKKNKTVRRPVSSNNTAYQQVNAQQSTSSGSYQQPQKPQRANYPVTCPNCGATAYPKDDGTCEYCGSKIM